MSDELFDLIRLMDGVLSTIERGGRKSRLDMTGLVGFVYQLYSLMTEDAETAIVDSVSAYPVERYETEEQAVAGHEKWKKAAPDLKSVVRLGYGSLIEDETKELVPGLLN